MRAFLPAAALLGLCAAVTVAVPAMAQTQSTVKMATCKDGTTSKPGQGACSGHGGVAAPKAAAKADEKVGKANAKEAKTDIKADAKATKDKQVAHADAKDTKADANKAKIDAQAKAMGSMVTCTDGSMSKKGQGACSGHGGVSPAKTAETDAKAAQMKADAKANEKQTDANVNKMKADAKAKEKQADAKADAAGKAIAKCTDGTMSYAKTHAGACSGHGGVNAWLDGSSKKP